MLKLALDIGSTTIKYVLLDENNNIIYKNYKRHYSHIKDNIIEELLKIRDKNIINNNFLLAFSGSAGMGIAEDLGIPFVQEVYATKVAAEKLIPNTDCIIELGGEDAKILFLSNFMEVRMNGSCAGGTGAFIDQMATLLNVDITEINNLAADYQKLYSIASRCGVFAKTDIQPLLNQGASKSDIAASIFRAVVNQTIGGLAQGRIIKGNVAYLGGPLTFLTELTRSFDEVLNIKGTTPDNSLYFVAIGAALLASEKFNLIDLINNLTIYENKHTFSYNLPLFKDSSEYKEFIERHEKDKIDILPLDNYNGPLYLGIDSGSTTLKIVLIDEDENIRFSSYNNNKGNPIEVVREVLIDLYTKYPNIKILKSASTGYGEELIKNAFMLDSGLVETFAHYIAAKKFMPSVDFIIDIGGQDIKCFKIEKGAISNIFLNEACSSGCGSFLQTFANALGYSVEDFAKLALFARKPVDLGSRCTVFMNSSIKQAQKDGATIDNISAGLAISVVKNALYKVIRTTNKSELGKNIVVQGGTFNNKAVLRAFEKELGLNVICPNIAGLMGAYGASLYAKRLNSYNTNITLDGLKSFKHEIKTINCNGCNNHCLLSINTFTNNPNKYISGNQCEKPLSIKSKVIGFNLFTFIQEEIENYFDYYDSNNKETIAIPLVLNMYELLPFWYTLFKELGFNVHTSGFSTPNTFTLGQQTIPSDTVCFPAKLVHGHIKTLLNDGYKNIFYPCMSYNVDEGLGDNHYNCPIVAYYPENIINNDDEIRKINFISDFLSIDDLKVLKEKIDLTLSKYFKTYNKDKISLAVDKAIDEYHNHVNRIREKGMEYINNARSLGQDIIVLGSRPYHLDPIVNHGIDKLIASMGLTVISEDSISHLTDKFKVHVLNQWTNHSRLYSAAKYCTKQNDMHLVQLISFGCGVDAITSDECKLILESNDKIYTQLKIDEITNLGTIKIRLRSLIEAIKQKKEGKHE